MSCGTRSMTVSWLLQCTDKAVRTHTLISNDSVFVIISIKTTKIISINEWNERYSFLLVGVVE